ncbi:hypothetical protein JOD64_002887 [Micromonospora luteifusca]|uniref:Integrase n=1 Tax=Micromonospora luteifusca TaxID=709860 RepID=A0ABS2LU44_9ACTN|nr:hypothetical protein [Micromonospora luteifusca]MBM7491665.1 hypothetical protein [Micromonospora luteifusca]
MHAVLRVALADAERMDLVPRNAAKAAKPPALSRAERRALTPEECKTLLSGWAGDRLEPLLVLARVRQAASAIDRVLGEEGTV